MVNQAIQMLSPDDARLITLFYKGEQSLDEIGQIRWQNLYTFPLIGVAPEDLVTWPGGPQSAKFLWWGKQRWQSPTTA